MIRYNTSLRSRPISETLSFAEKYARQYGITRVTNTTRLDDIGVPVYASIRPDAARGSLCVSAGKGLTNGEAQAGAFMEALELSMAEPRRKKLPIVRAKVSAVLDGAVRPEAILDFCPKMGVEIDLDQTIDCVSAIDLFSGNSFLVPAETAYIPSPSQLSYFGSTSNGLCSGNTVTEATIHGLLEVIERDISSFQTIHPRLQLVSPGAFPEKVRQVYEQVRRAGHDLVLQYGSNEYGIPYFIATLIDSEMEDPIYFNGGYGCHIFKEIAMMRAATEAIQSRLSLIHGGRDDLLEAHKFAEGLDARQRSVVFRTLAKLLRNSSREIDFADIPEFNWRHTTMAGPISSLMQLIRERGVDYLLRVSFTRPEEPLQVAKIIVPKMEFFNYQTKKIGIRLRNYAAEIANDPVRRPDADAGGKKTHPRT